MDAGEDLEKIDHFRHRCRLPASLQAVADSRLNPRDASPALLLIGEKASHFSGLFSLICTP